jgi:hypothetical protein
MCGKQTRRLLETAPNRWIASVLLIASIAVFDLADADIDSAFATPMCPGPTTADGLACCAAGSTPTSDDTCQLPGGGVAASCALTQLTSSGTCCPASSSPQSDGTCLVNGQPNNGYPSMPGCPLGQLNQGGLSCCPSDETPQADGSCQSSAAQATTVQPGAQLQNILLPQCPEGGAQTPANAPTWVCLAYPTCTPGSTPFNPYNGYCCPPGSQPTAVATGGEVCVGPTVVNGTVVQNSVVPPDAGLICPSGAPPVYFDGMGILQCVLPASCPLGYRLVRWGCIYSRLLLLNPKVFLWYLSSSNKKSSSGPTPQPPVSRPVAGCASGYVLSADGMCHRTTIPGMSAPIITPQSPTPSPSPLSNCPAGQVRVSLDGACACPVGAECGAPVPAPVACVGGTVLESVCRCPTDASLVNGVCEKPTTTSTPCQSGGEMRNGDGACVCPPGESVLNGSCRKLGTPTRTIETSPPKIIEPPQPKINHTTLPKINQIRPPKIIKTKPSATKKR